MEPESPSERHVRVAEDLYAALKRLDAALAKKRISSAEHRRQIEAIGLWMKQRGVRFGQPPFGPADNLYDAWTKPHR